MQSTNNEEEEKEEMSSLSPPIKKEHDSKASSTTAIIDNPYWGSPTACSLADLLAHIASQQQQPKQQQQQASNKIILYESPSYLAINKPADLRMDGEFPATVHKLLTCWYPPPSLQGVQQQLRLLRNNDDNNNNNKNALWLDEIAKYHRHSDHVDNELRPCHQLDYATSGVLLVARNKQAASHARHCFEQRTVKKQYLALLQGHVLSNHKDNWPVLSRETVQCRLKEWERTFRKARFKSTHQRKRRPAGYQPAHALYQQWQHAVLKSTNDRNHEQQQQSPSPPLQRPGKKSKLSHSEWTHVWKALQAETCQPPLDPHQDWAHVKQRKETARFQRTADVYNGILTRQQEQQRQEEESSSCGNNKDDTHDDIRSDTKKNPFPLFFRVAEDDNKDSFYIAAPLAQVDDDFAMRLPPHLLLLSSTSETRATIPSPLQVGKADLIYRPALTQCIVLQRGTLTTKANNNNNNNHHHHHHYEPPPQAVTKVRLLPQTGRRHQLRVHCALLGHAIVGDYTYNCDGTNTSANDDDEDDDNSKPKPRRNHERMCLHSQRLELPSLDDKSSTLRIEAPDPFGLDFLCGE